MNNLDGKIVAKKDNDVLLHWIPRVRPDTDGGLNGSMQHLRKHGSLQPLSFQTNPVHIVSRRLKSL